MRAKLWAMLLGVGLAGLVLALAVPEGQRARAAAPPKDKDKAKEKGKKADPPAATDLVLLRASFGDAEGYAAGLGQPVISDTDGPGGVGISLENRGFSFVAGAVNPRPYAVAAFPLTDGKPMSSPPAPVIRLYLKSTVNQTAVLEVRDGRRALTAPTEVAFNAGEEKSVDFAIESPWRSISYTYMANWQVHIDANRDGGRTPRKLSVDIPVRIYVILRPSKTGMVYRETLYFLACQGANELRSVERRVWSRTFEQLAVPSVALGRDMQFWGVTSPADTNLDTYLKRGSEELIREGSGASLAWARLPRDVFAMHDITATIYEVQPDPTAADFPELPTFPLMPGAGNFVTLASLGILFPGHLWQGAGTAADGDPAFTGTIATGGFPFKLELRPTLPDSLAWTAPEVKDSRRRGQGLEQATVAWGQFRSGQGHHLVLVTEPRSRPNDPTEDEMIMRWYDPSYGRLYRGRESKCEFENAQCTRID